ncbi:MAG: flavodoxin domain-containing protein [Oleibacter sp.]|nr:flavodoxin domain-containing protein [Thalassolituus sp.]
MANVYIPIGTVSGTATAVAEALATVLAESGHSAVLDSSASVEKMQSDQFDAILVVTSTTGQGDIPSNLIPFYAQLEDLFPLQNGRPFGVISLGDSSYDQTFCNAGALMEEKLYELQGVAPVPRVTIDATETQTPDVDAIFWLREWMPKALS